MRREYFNKMHAILAAVCLGFYAQFFFFAAFTFNIDSVNSLGLAPIILGIMIIHIAANLVYGAVVFLKTGKIFSQFVILLSSYAFCALIFYSVLVAIRPGELAEILNWILTFACFLPLALVSALVTKLLSRLIRIAKKKWPRIGLSKLQKTYLLFLFSIFCAVQLRLCAGLSSVFGMFIGQMSLFVYLYILQPAAAVAYGIIAYKRTKNAVLPSTLLVGAHSLFSFVGVILYCTYKNTDLTDVFFYIPNYLFEAVLFGIISLVAAFIAKSIGSRIEKNR